MIGCGASFCGALLGHFWRVASSVTRVTCSGGRSVVAFRAWFGGGFWGVVQWWLLGRGSVMAFGVWFLRDGFWGQSVVGLVGWLTMRAPHQVLLLCGSLWGVLKSELKMDVTKR